MSKEDFYNLTPDVVLEGLSHIGYVSTGEYIQLNSYENRVFDIRLEKTNAQPLTSVIVKFYRPHRWSFATIHDEHAFLEDLIGGGIPAIAPIKNPKGETIHKWNNMFFTVFPKARGRMIDELQFDDYKRIGRTLARMHNIGSQKKAAQRPQFDMDTYGWNSLRALETFIPKELLSQYLEPAEEILNFLEENLQPEKFIRIHGDCHRGNILKTDPKEGLPEYFFVDFDDCCMGPPVQDFWMLLSAPDHTDEADVELEALFTGYNEFRKMEMEDLDIIPALRGLRIIHYSAWIARRWEDPTFPRLFPQFTEHNYWLSEMDSLREIAASLY